MIEILKSAVENKFGKKITCQKDCKLLSINISESTGEYLSPATIRRLYGFLLTNSNPSRVTFDILSRYIGFSDWNKFIESNHENAGNNIKDNSWIRVAEKSKKITRETLEALKLKSGIQFAKAIERQFANERLDFFLNSEYSSTAFIGPGGYGKSTSLLKWVDKRLVDKKNENDIIIITQALDFSSFANSESYIEDWLLRQLGLPSDYNFLRNLKSKLNKTLGKFIIIIDGLDETNLQGSKLEKVYSSIADLSLNFSSEKWFKLIISTRFYTWNKFKTFIANEEKWFHTKLQTFSLDNANLPLFTSDEIQKILDNTINTNFPKRTLIDELSIELRETLTYPYFLQLFISVYHPENEYLLNDQIEIFNEFLKKQVYNANYSEEKNDIIYKILELSEYGINPNAVKKNTLKEIYPVNLKLGGNYFAAYEDLISFGIITEDDIENKFGSHFKIVRISNSNLFEILIAKSLLENDEDISITFIKEVEKKYSSSDLLGHIITRLYQFAYKSRILKPLISFFDLKDSTLKEVLSTPQIAITLRKDEYLRKHLLPVYASNPVARQYFYVDFPDINNITGTFSTSVDYYLKHFDTDEEENNAYILHLYSAILSLDEGKIERFYDKLKDFTPNGNLSSSIIGKWYASKYIYHYMLKNDTSTKKVLNEALEFLKAIRQSTDYRYGDFESTFYCSLILTNQYQTLKELIKKDSIIENSNTGGTNNTFKLFQHTSNLLSGKQIELSDIIEIDQILSQQNPLDSHLNKILGLTLKSAFYLNNNEMSSAYNSFRNATELSNLAGLKIIEVKLMKNLASVLLRLGEKTKSAECNSLAEQIIYKTGFKYELF